MADELIPLSAIALDLPAPPAGWAFELERRAIPILLDDIGRPAVSRDAARDLLTERREQEEAAARKRAAVEKRALEADREFRLNLPPGIPLSAEVPGLTPAMLMMAADPMDQGSRRESVVEHALANPDGALVFHPIRDEP